MSYSKYYKAMKRFNLMAALLCLVLGAAAQNATRVMLFPEFQKAMIFTCRGLTPAEINYDAGNTALLYMHDGQEMRLTNVQDIDSIVVGKRVLVPIKGNFAEKFQAGAHTLLVEWKISIIDEGFRNAYGQVTHQARTNTGKTYQVTSDTGKSTDTGDGDPYVVRRQDFSNFYVLRDGKPLRYKDKKSFLKIFPEQTETIEAYVQQHDVKFDKYEQVLELLRTLP